MTSIEASASTVPSGSTFDVTWTVQNEGAGDADRSWPDVLNLREAPGGSSRTIGLGVFDLQRYTGRRQVVYAHREVYSACGLPG